MEIAELVKKQELMPCGMTTILASEASFSRKLTQHYPRYLRHAKISQGYHELRIHTFIMDRATHSERWLFSIRRYRLIRSD